MCVASFFLFLFPLFLPLSTSTRNFSCGAQICAGSLCDEWRCDCECVCCGASECKIYVVLKDESVCVRFECK